MCSDCLSYTCSLRLWYVSCRFITESADRERLQYYVPCHGGVPCSALDLPLDVSGLRNVSVVAGHFFWNVWDRLPSCKEPNQTVAVEVDREGQAGNESTSTGCAPSCMVMGRHPVDRAISYYYQRCYGSEGCAGYRRRINDLSPEELEWITVHQREGREGVDAAGQPVLVVGDEGMSDATCRSLAGAKATTGSMLQDGVPIPIPPPLGETELQTALRNVRTCVVGLLERWSESQLVFNAWFPWIDFSKDRERRKMFIYSNKETRADLRPELREVLERQNRCDMVVYAEMERLFEVQLSAAEQSRNLYDQQ